MADAAAVEKARLQAEAEAAAAQAARLQAEASAAAAAKAAAEAAAVAAPVSPPKKQNSWWKPSAKPSVAERALAEAVALFEEATGLVVDTVASTAAPPPSSAPHQQPSPQVAADKGSLNELPVAVVAGAVQKFEASTGLVVDTIAANKELPMKKRSVSLSVRVM